MCGIGGIVQLNTNRFNRVHLQAMNDSMVHRGPDDHGYLAWLPGESPVKTKEMEQLGSFKVGFVHRRLSILDLSEKGWQPMSTEDNRYHIIFNGEVYNYIELRDQLIREGEQFYSGTDTEVILKAIANWGIEAVKHFTGMFALVILDIKEQQLLLARDPFGIKPLYYTCQKGFFAFASEIKTLLELPSIRRTVDPQMMYDYLHLGQMDHTRRTFFKEIKSFPAAHWAKLPVDEPNNLSLKSYWDVDTTTRWNGTRNEAVDRLREKFLHNIKLHLRSDVPLGSALSGGIDSSAIVNSIRKLNPDTSLYTFSFISENEEKNEEKWVDLATESSNAIKHKVKPSAQELVNDLDDLIKIQDEPFGSTSIYAQYRVFKLAAENRITVMLDGQGADEILAGYLNYYNSKMKLLAGQLKWYSLYRLAEKSSPIFKVSGIKLFGWALLSSFSQSLTDSLVQFFKERDPYEHCIKKEWFRDRGIQMNGNLNSHSTVKDLKSSLARDITYNNLPQLLRFEDRNSMAFSIESRVPFLTTEMVDLIMSFPESFILTDQGTTKSVFRDAMRGIAPDEILDRKDKIGFATPEQQWLYTLEDWVSNVFREAEGLGIPGIDLDEIRKQWEILLEGNGRFDWQIWRWINFIRWAELYKVTFT